MLNIDRRAYALKILSGASASEIIDLKVNGTESYVACAVEIPAGMTSATVGFKCGDDPLNLTTLNYEGSPLTINTTSGGLHTFEPRLFLGFRYVQVVAAGNEGDDRDLKLFATLRL